jgi:hypothetical protein
MASYRKLVPLRSIESLMEIADGTMCRMPSPLPGPLRGEGSEELKASESYFASRRFARLTTASASLVPANLSNHVLRLAVEKVA